MQNEATILETRLHWAVFSSTIVWLIIAALLFTLCRRWSFFTSMLFAQPVYLWLTLIALFITLMHALTTGLRYLTSQYVITERRLLSKTGLLHRKTLEIFLVKIDSVQVGQSLFGRLCNFGTITISGSSGSKVVLPNIPKPAIFSRTIHRQIHH